MRRLGAIAAFGLMTALATSAGAQPVTLDLRLTGANEVSNTTPPQIGVGDPDGLATGTLTLDPDGDMISWDFDYENISGASISGFHIHGPDASLTTNKGIFIDLSPPPGTLTPSGSLSGMRMAPDATYPNLGAMIDQILANREGFYLNLHSANPGGFPGGAVRAQLPEPASLSLLGVAGLALLRRRRACR